MPKILPHIFFEEYDYSIYVDAKMRVIGDMKDYIDVYGKNAAMLCFPHFVRDCCYEEAKACIIAQKVRCSEEEINRQMEEYRKEGFPEHFGLIDSCCMVRKHDDALVKETMELWWKEIMRWESRRDQLSFNYVCWKTGLKYDICNLFSNHNPYIHYEREDA